MIWILGFLGTLVVMCILFLLPMWLTHYFNMFRFILGKNHIINHSFKHFKKNFKLIEWKREFSFRTSFFPKIASRDNNYIHADIVIINGVVYRFYFISFLRYKLFLFRNRTNERNYRQTVNSLKQKRKNKLKIIEKI